MAVYIVTGGNSGIGFETALSLAKAGHTVLIGGRTKQRLGEAVTSIRTLSSNERVEGIAVDLGSLASVHHFAKQITSSHKQVDGIVCNAGVNAATFEWSADGVESTFATNHLGHFYLVQLLRPYLRPTARIVVTSSGMHDPTRLKTPIPAPGWTHPSDLAMLKPDPQATPPAKFNGTHTYTNSKLCNIYFTYQLAKELQQQGSAVTATAYDPGYIPGTSLSRGRPRWQVRLMEFLIPVMMLLTGCPQRPSSAPFSGNFQARLAHDVSFHAKTGLYYEIDHEQRSSVASYDEAKAVELWAYSQELLGQLGAAERL
jgi:NAD(P)-dependent dehydrogenase (short-subunit alcohol dehydrogenase family)